VKHLKCHPSIFPDRRCINIPRELLAGAGSIILARQRGAGLQPFALCLPHQVYVEDLPKLLDGARELWALPVGARARWVQIAGPNPGETHGDLR